MNRLGLETWPPARTDPVPQMQVRETGRDLLFILFKWLPQMAVIVGIGLVCGLGYLTLIRGNQFQADAKLYVRVGVDQTPSPILGSDRNVTFLAQTRGAVQSEMDLLRNDVLVQRLIAELDLASPAKRAPPSGLYETLKRFAIDVYETAKEASDSVLVAVGLKTPLSREAVVRQTFSQSLIVDNAPGSDIISVSLRWPDEAQAVLILDHFLKIYTNFRSAVFQGSEETDFLTEKRDAAKSAVEAIEAEMTRFEREHDIRNAASRAPLLEADLVDAQRTLERNALELGLARRRLERLGQGFGRVAGQRGEQREAAGLGTFPPNSPALGMADTMTKLLGERERLLVNNTTEAPEVREVEAKIAALSVVLRRQLEAEVQDLVRTESTARERLNRSEAELRELQGSSAGWKSLERRRELAETRYRDAEKRLGEARDISALRNARLSNVVVVQPAAPEGVPIGLRKLPMLGIIALCAAVLAAGWALAREIFDARLYRGGPATQELGLPLIGEIPESRALLSAWACRRGDDRAAGLALDRLVVTLDERLRTGERTSLAVVGAGPGEGASSLALALAAGIGRRRRSKTCLVTGSTGMADLFARLLDLGLVPSALAHTPDMPAWLWRMEAGEHLVVASLSDPKGLAAFLAPDSGREAGFRGGADLVIVDLPPLSEDAETAPTAARADATLLVVGAGLQDGAQHTAALETLNGHGAQVIGFVLNRVRGFVPRWLERVR